MKNEQDESKLYARVNETYLGCRMGGNKDQKVCQ